VRGEFHSSPTILARIVILLGLTGARSSRPPSACAGDSRAARRSRRRPFRGGGIRARQAPADSSSIGPENDRPTSAPLIVSSSADQWARRIVGCGVHRGVVDGLALCQMFNSSDLWPHPAEVPQLGPCPLYRFHQWQANLRILDVKAIKTVPHAPLSHHSSNASSERYVANVWTGHCLEGGGSGAEDR
jgi:hypothetical protein